MDNCINSEVINFSNIIVILRKTGRNGHEKASIEIAAHKFSSLQKGVSVMSIGISQLGRKQRA